MEKMLKAEKNRKERLIEHVKVMNDKLRQKAKGGDMKNVFMNMRSSDMPLEDR